MAPNKTAYAKHQDFLRKEAKRKARIGVRGFPVVAAKHGTCGAQRKKGGKCLMPAGWGTSHMGNGACKLHGGRSPTHIKKAAKEGFRQLFGTPMEIDPLNAIIWCIKVTAGEVQWLSDRMAELDSKDWVEDTMMGKQFHLYARERKNRMQDLVKFSAQAVSLGLAERAIKMAETYGQLLAAYTQGLLEDFMPYMNEEGRAKAPQFVRARLLQLDQGATPEMLQIEAA